MLREPRARSQQRLRNAGFFSLIPLLVFLLLTSGYNSGQPPQVRADNDNGGHIENTVVIPSYHEAGNIPALVTRIFQAVESPDTTEVVIVDDDSRDGTEEAVERLREEGYNVAVVTRKDESGLSSAVLRGLKEARGSKFVIMDADLQHPPESVPHFFKALSERRPFVMGTRYGPSGAVDKDWPFLRRLMSGVARSLARPLTSTSDPMSGFFGLTKDLYTQAAHVNPVGFKIALELLLKTGIPDDRVAEVSYAFAKRTVGASKLSSKTVLKYLFHLATLYRWRMGFFGLVFFEALLVGGCWVALYALEVGVVWWRQQRRQAYRRREKGRLDV
ncbi:nucleotide-diphospho-sugar transferase [Mycena pura]|uniref:Dolichol-phosphate mannosyltransferase subunit 1 n=1 Tax=Mycena pura TaxID=153505 RepID=A0AAD6VHI5_9AGAR|nr:nucleotide-diphospho-sugar transferase [Mycena pura]